MKIGDRVFVRGYIDEIRKDTVIIRNAGGYFGTIPSEVITGELPSAQPELEKKTGKRPAPTRAEMIDILTRRHDALVAVWMTADTPEQYKLAREIGAIEKMLRLYGAM